MPSTLKLDRKSPSYDQVISKHFTVTCIYIYLYIHTTGIVKMPACMSYSLNSLNGGYIEGYIWDYYSGY